MDAPNAALLIDGGFFSKVKKFLNAEDQKLDLVGLSDDLCKPFIRLRTYYYDALRG